MESVEIFFYLELKSEYKSSELSGGESSISDAYMEGSPRTKIDLANIKNSDVEVRDPCDVINPNEDCSTSGTFQPETVKVVQRNRSHGTGERNKQERHEKTETSSEILNGSRKHEPSATTLLVNTNMTSVDSSMDIVTDRKDNFEIVLGMKELASQGTAAEVVEEMNALDPNFFAQKPLLLFQPKQEFLAFPRADAIHLLAQYI